MIGRGDRAPAFEHYDTVLASLLLASRSANEPKTQRYLDRAIETLLPGGDSSADRRAPKAVGEFAPEFQLPGVGANGREQFRLSEYTDTGPVVLSFYPFDFSPVCTSHLCTFQEMEWLTVDGDVDVFGISIDSTYAHEAFRRQQDIAFPLLTDRLAKVADAYGVKYDTWEGHPAVCQRALFGIDQNGIIQYQWHTEDATESPTIDEVSNTVAWAE